MFSDHDETDWCGRYHTESEENEKLQKENKNLREEIEELRKNPDRLLNSKEAAAYLNVKVPILWEWRNRAIVNLPYHKVSDRIFLYRQSDLDNFLSECRVEQFSAKEKKEENEKLKDQIKKYELEHDSSGPQHDIDTVLSILGVKIE